MNLINIPTPSELREARPATLAAQANMLLTRITSVLSLRWVPGEEVSIYVGDEPSDVQEFVADLLTKSGWIVREPVLNLWRISEAKVDGTTD